MDTKIEEKEFQHECLYCGKLNLLEKHREVFFGLKDCIDANLKEMRSLKREQEDLKEANVKLEANIETLRKANTQLVVEYEDKLCTEKDHIHGLDEKLSACADYDQLTTNYNQLTQRFNTISDKMEEVIKQNTDLTKQKRELMDKIEQLEKEAQTVDKPEPTLEVTVDNEAFRAKIKAEMEREQKSQLEKMREEFSQKYDEMRKSFALKVQPLEKKKT